MLSVLTRWEMAASDDVKVRRGLGLGVARVEVVAELVGVDLDLGH